jgi:pyruvate dehydrogenase E2 component (dihydrolipoyllysine-residue acetyltransferase)
MAQPITLPKLGQMVEESTITKWLKQEGDIVKKGDILFEMETDKSVMEVESFFDGTLIKIVVPAGQTIPVMETVAYIGRPDEAVHDSESKPSVKAPLESTIPEAPTTLAPTDPRQPKGTEPGHPQPAGPEELFRISPRAARFARQAAIDPTLVIGTGPEGRVVERDVRAYLAAQTGAQPEAAQAHTVAESIPMTRMRQVIAQRLTDSYRTAPHFFVTVSVDMTDLVTLREDLKAQGIGYSISDFILKSVALTLPEFPPLNSKNDGKEIWRQKDVNLGMAVSLDEGLVVPVLRRANTMSLGDIHTQSADLTTRARAGKLKPDDMAGGTFTISNMGMYDVENFTAIINPGESAILAVSSITDTAVVRQRQIVVRKLMKMTLSSDHRLVDGALAVAFINSVKRRLENTVSWKTLTQPTG